MRKGAVTVFVIIGLFLVLSVAVTLYLRGEESVFHKQLTGVSKDVNMYVEDCIRLVATDGIRKLGSQGGYIDPLSGRYDGANYSFTLIPTESDGVFFGNTQTPVVYWHYLSTPNDCTECMVVSNTTPSVENMQQQLNQYIKEMGPRCIDEFSSFTYQRIHVESGDWTPDVLFTEEDIRVNVDFPLRIVTETDTVSLDSFSISLPVELRHMVELGQDIVTLQHETQFLEETTLALLSQSFSLQPDGLPPFAASDRRDKTTTWNLLDVAESVQTLLISYIPLLRLAEDDTHFGNFYDDPLNKKLLIHGLEDRYPFAVRFYHLGWNPYVDITPRTGTALMPETTVQKFPFKLAKNARTNVYEFFYDISYPVIVELYDPSAHQDVGFRFRFALEVNIRDNIPLRKWAQGHGTLGTFQPEWVTIDTYISAPISEPCRPEDPSVLQSLNIDNSLDSNYSQPAQVQQLLREVPYICPKTNATYPNLQSCQLGCYTDVGTQLPKRSSVSFFCDPIQQVGSVLNLTVLDEVTRHHIESYTYTYSCGDYSSCAYDETNRKLPMCAGGSLVISSNGYLPSRIFIDSFGGEVQRTVALKPVREVDVSLHVEDITPESFLLDSFNSTQQRNVSQTESIVLTFSLVDSQDLEQDFVQKVYFENGSKLDGHVLLTPGVYEVQVQQVDFSGAVIPAHCYKYCKKMSLDTDALGKFKIQCEFGYEPQEDIEMPTIVSGGLVLNNNTGYWNVTDEMFAGARRVHFRVVGVPKPTCVKTVKREQESLILDPRVHPLSSVEYCEVGTCISPQDAINLEKYSLLYRMQLEPIIT